MAITIFIASLFYIQAFALWGLVNTASPKRPFLVLLTFPLKSVYSCAEGLKPIKSKVMVANCFMALAFWFLGFAKTMPYMRVLVMV